MGGAIQRYRKSADFIRLAQSTQKEYERLLNEIAADVGEVRLAEVDIAWITDLRDLWAPRGHKATNDRVQVLKNALAPAVKDQRIKLNPFAGLERLAPRHGTDEANPAWTDAEVDAFIAHAISSKQPGLARAAALARWGGFRRGTVCRLPAYARLEVENDEGRIERRLYWITEKRHVTCDKREDARLTALLASTPSASPYVAYNKRGEQWKERALNHAFDRVIEALSAKGKIRPQLTIHGLRHSRGIELAHAGSSDAEIMAQLEHKSERAARIYRSQANRRLTADSGQDRIDEKIRLRALKNGGMRTEVTL